MIYRFDAYTLDVSRGLLLCDGNEVAIEPRAFAFLSYMIENPDRLVSKDELVEKIWEGRFISDAAISTLIKTARRALDDDGKAQRLIRTVHGRGFRFAGTVEQAVPARPKQEVNAVSGGGQTAANFGNQPSIAVFPFRMFGQSETFSAIADAVPSELITSLSRLRWLKVIARGSSFRFREATLDLEAIHEKLGVGYCLTGDIEIFGNNLAIAVELVDPRDGRIVWGDRLSGTIDDVHQMRADIAARVSTAMELQISLNEAERARLQSPQTLDAWSLYHMGLRHMYRFNPTANAIAASHFARATELDPGFARAFAARSFTSFQTVYVNYSADRAVEIENARRFSEKCLELDPLDPFGNFNYGRSYWLHGDHEAGQPYLDRAIGLSPSFSHGLYAYAYSNIMAGRREAGVEQLERAIELSPLDPFLFAMETLKSVSFLHADDFEQASIWADRGSRQPGAHYICMFMAAAINQIAGNHAQARYWADRTRQLRPDATIQQFFHSYRLQDQTVRNNLLVVLQELGFSKQ